MVAKVVSRAVGSVEQPPRQIETRYGLLDAPIPSQDLIGRFLSVYGEWGWDETAFLAAQLPDGARVLDGGAFVGTFGLGLATLRRLGLLCAVEANQHLNEALERNLARNCGAPYVALPALIAGPEPAERVGRGDRENLGAMSFAADAHGDILAPAPTCVVTLADLRERYGPFDLIKLDLEGMEVEALRGDAAFLSTGETMLWLECNEHPSALTLLDLLLAWGLQVHYFAAPSHNPDNNNRISDPILPWAYEAGLLVSRTPPVLGDTLARHGCFVRRIACRADLEEAMWLTPRWLPSAYAHASPSELAAIASRAIAAQSREQFLAAGAGDRADDPAAAAAMTVAEGRALAGKRLTMLGVERERRIRTEQGLSDAQKIAAEQQASLAEAHKRIAEAEQALARAEERASVGLLLLEQEQGLRASAEAALADAAAAGLEHLAEMGRVTDEADARVSQAIAEAQAAADAEVGRVTDEAEARVSQALTEAGAANARYEEQTSTLGEHRRVVAQLQAMLEERQGVLETLDRQARALEDAVLYLESEQARQRDTIAWPAYRFIEKLTRGLDKFLRRRRAAKNAAPGS